MKTFLLLALSALMAGAAHAQTAATESARDYPSRPLRQIVPFPPGGAVDIVTRIVAAKWSELIGQQILVENRAGAGGTVCAVAPARAPPAGSTLFTFQY